MLSLRRIRHMTGVQWSGIVYFLGTFILLASGGLSRDCLQLTAAILILAGSAVQMFLKSYWGGCFLRLLGLVALFTSLQWDVTTQVTAAFIMPALAYGSLEPFIRDKTRMKWWVLVLSLISRVPFIVTTWGTWLVVVAAIWLLGDILLSRSTLKK